MQIEITFQKPTYVGFLVSELRYELETFTHQCDPSKSEYENLNDAYDIAISKGHQPNKNIRWKFIE